MTEIIGPLLSMTDPELLAFTRMTGVDWQHSGVAETVVAALHGTAAARGGDCAGVAHLASPSRQPSSRFCLCVGLAGADMGAAWLLPRSLVWDGLRKF